MRSGSLAYLLTLATDDTSVPDAELLARFAGNGDAAAFELLVRRHADLVWRVCRCELPHDAHSAEDAFQTTFLVLARKAGSVRGSTVAGYLFRVARNAALRVRKRVGNVTEATLEMGVEPAEPNECSVAVIEEVERLPDKFRLPVLLCFFEDCTHVEAANRLGWAVGTVASRLARAKDRLRVRLTHRGMALPAILAGVSVPAATVRAAVMMATTPSAVPTLLSELSREVSIVMANAKAKWIGGGILATLLLTGSVGMMARTAGPGPEEPTPAAKVKPATKAPVPETPEAADLKKLQGVWRITKIENNRGVAPAKDIEPMRWEIVGSIVTAIDGPDEKRHKSRIALDASTSPKRITQTELTDDEDKPGRKIECIYELKGDTLRICMGDTRPTEFKVEQGVDGGLIELERMPDAVSELKKFQGRWRVTKLVGDPGIATAKEIESMRWEFTGDTISCQDGPGKEVKMKFTFDATKSPKQITMTAPPVPEAQVGTKLEGIYEFKDDTLRICFGKVRPTEFKVAKEGNDGLVELERLPKPEAKAPKKETPEAAELKKLQGVWRVTKLETTRGVAPAKEIEPMRWEFVGDTVFTIDGPEESQKLKMQVVIDVSKSPKQMIATGRTRTRESVVENKAEGIYELKGDTLRFCSSFPGKPLPTEFKVEKDSDTSLIEFERVPKGIRELKDLAGEWKYSAVQEGKELSTGTMDIYRDVIWITLGDKVEKAIVSLDSDNGFFDITPITAPAKPILGRFTWKDDKLTIYSGLPGAERPAEAKAGKGVTVAVMVRAVKK